MPVIWTAAWVLVAIFAVGVEPWDALMQALANGGVNDEGYSVLAFVAGYTLPLTAAIGGLTLAWLLGAAEAHNSASVLTVVGLVLWGAGFAAAELGLGLLPSAAFQPVSGPPWVALPVNALQAYFASYGFPLMICSLAIGVAGAMQIAHWLRSTRESFS